MLRNFLIFSLLFVAINADGKFAVLQAPSSLSFHGNEPIPAGDVGEIIAASTGNSVSGSSSWSGLTIDSPFELPRKVVVVFVEGTTVDVTPAKYVTTVEGSGIGESLDILVQDAREDKLSTCDIDYSMYKATSNKCFGSAVGRNEALPLPSTKSLSQTDGVARDFLSAIADLNAAVDSYQKSRDNKDVEMKSVAVVRLYVDSIVKAYGADSAQVAEAVDLLKTTISKVQKASGDSLFVVASGKTAPKLRSKREVITGGTNNTYNLADNYDENYPVIFNIILWFMVAFALSLLAISYAIGSMDPGRDSIIYRMTSTRMKKDN